MDQATRNRILSLMQSDLDFSAKKMSSWLDEPCTTDDDGNDLTPRQVFQQVKDGTPWGDRYAEEWLRRNDMLEKLMSLDGFLFDRLKQNTDNSKIN